MFGDKMKVSLKHIKEPWSYVAIREAYFHDFRETEVIIEATEGGRLWNELNSLEESVWIFDSCISDLLDEIADFAHQTTKEGFWSRLNSSNRETYERRVKKFIFTSTSAAMALVDHARKFNGTYPCPDFDKERAERFGDSGIHEFIQKLRNYISHWRLAEANWEITWAEKSRNVKFILISEELLCWDGWTVPARKFIEASGKCIDIYKLFSTYNNIACKLYQWHKAKMLASWQETLIPYFKYKKCLNQIKEHTSWNLLLSHAPKEKDPYEFLGKYLTNDQITEVFSFEYKTAEQITRLIEILDLHGACDEGLRAKINECILARP
jgi:hypothetical protein